MCTINIPSGRMVSRLCLRHSYPCKEDRSSSAIVERGVVAAVEALATQQKSHFVPMDVLALLHV